MNFENIINFITVIILVCHAVKIAAVGISSTVLNRAFHCMVFLTLAMNLTLGIIA